MNQERNQGKVIKVVDTLRVMGDIFLESLTYPIGTSTIIYNVQNRSISIEREIKTIIKPKDS